MVILGAKSKLEKLDDFFWQKLNDDKKLFLEKDIAPLMRTRTGEDYKAMSFELKVINYSIAKLDVQTGQDKKAKTLEEVIVEMVSDLPLSVNVVAKEKELIEEVLNNGYLEKADEEVFRNLNPKNRASYEIP